MKILVRLRWFLILTCTLIVVASCKVVEDDIVVVTAPPEYSVDLFEQRDSADGTPAFGLWLESVDKYECPGYGINATVQVQNGSIEAAILGVFKPSTCMGDSATAKQFLPIGNLANGTYEFRLSLRDVIVNKGSLKVENGYYALSLPDAKGVFVENFIMESLPDGIIWGYANTPDEVSQPVADNFLADLKTLSAEHGLPAGFYSYFTISGTGDITFHKRVAPDGAAKHFVRRLTDSPNALKSILQNYRDATQQPLNIRCWTTGGEL